MAKLNQIIAIQAGQKTRTKELLTKAYHQIQKTELMNGLSRTYRPKDENGEQRPPESKLVQVKTVHVIDDVKDALTELFDIVATQDSANCVAVADVVVDGKTLLSAVPVTTLLFLEKQIVDLTTFVGSLPVLDPSETWHYDSNVDCYASEPTQSLSTKKVPRNHIKYEATMQHPAQVDVFSEDVTVGTWTAVKFSGAAPSSEKNLILERLRKLSDAVKFAREEANSIEVTKVSIGKQVFGYLFAD